MKKSTTIFFCILILFLAIGLTDTSPAEAKTAWRSRTVKVKKGGFTFYAHISKNKKYSWIYKVSSKSTPKSLTFPKKIKGGKLIRLGYEKPTGEDSEFSKNIFDSYVEEAHNAPGYTKCITKVKKMTIPDSVATIEYDAFSGMSALQSATLPKSLKKLEESVFFGCPKLKSITLSRNMKEFNPYAFGDCGMLKNVSLSKKNKYFYAKNGMLFSRKKDKLFWIAPGLKQAAIPEGVQTIGSGCLYWSSLEKLTIPASVTAIEKNSLMSSWLTDIDLQGENPVYAKDGQSIYQKNTGALVVGIVKDRKLVISDKVTEISDDAMTAGDGFIVNDGSDLEVLDIPASVKTLRGYWTSFCHMNTNRDVYFRGVTPPAIINDCDPILYDGIPGFQTIHVPAESLDVYKNWAVERYPESYREILRKKTEQSSLEWQEGYCKWVAI